GECRFPARLGAVDLHNAAARVATDAERHVETDRACGNDGNFLVEGLPVLEPHDGPLTEFLFDSSNGKFEGFAAVLVVHGPVSPLLSYTAHSFSSQEACRRVGHCSSRLPGRGVSPRGL